VSKPFVWSIPLLAPMIRTLATPVNTLVGPATPLQLIKAFGESAANLRCPLYPESGRYWLLRDKVGAIGASYKGAASSVHMFNATLIVIEAFIRELRTMYERTYTTMEPDYPGVISFAAQLALENIATSDAA
jgi:hypothetical protein